VDVDMKKAILLTAILLLSLVAIACSIKQPVGDGPEITVFKSPTCGCCVGYTSELNKEGYNAEATSTQDMSMIKQQYNIPKSMESCHTAVMGNYFIEGHVPLAAVNKLLEEQPDIDGIAVPGMPAGSPGMPGIQQGPITVYAVSDGETSVFMEVGQ
jgi:hypothetical protein